MADEPVEPVDPSIALFEAHAKRMQEIADAGYQRSLGICDDYMASIKKQTGIKSNLLNKAIDALGLAPIPISPEISQPIPA